jgi:hypothetical protein
MPREGRAPSIHRAVGVDRPCPRGSGGYRVAAFAGEDTAGIHKDDIRLTLR